MNFKVGDLAMIVRSYCSCSYSTRFIGRIFTVAYVEENPTRFHGPCGMAIKSRFLGETANGGAPAFACIKINPPALEEEKETHEPKLISV